MRCAKATVARRVLRGYSPQQAKFEPKFEADPDLRASAEAYKKYFRDRRERP